MLAIAGLIVSMALVAIGNGLMFAYIPVSLGAAGYPPTWAGSILTGLSAGGIASCFLTAPLVRRVGHARAFMISSALIVLSNALVGAGILPFLWVAARVLYGFAICAMFIVAQSWLNDAVGNAIRGRVMAIFYVSYIVGLGRRLVFAELRRHRQGRRPAGRHRLHGAVDPAGRHDRLRQPPAPVGASVAFASAWRISPVGIAGMLAVGGLSMMIAGFAPIHATEKGFSQQEVAKLMFAMPLGTLIFQIPLGWISDRTDRRYVLIAAALLVVAAGIAASRLDGSTLVVLIMIYVVWSGASESIYSLSNAHANDRAGSGRSGDAVEHHAVCLVAVGLYRSGDRHDADRGLWHAVLHVCGDRHRRHVRGFRRLARGGMLAPRLSATAFAPMSAQTPVPVEPAASSGSKQ